MEKPKDITQNVFPKFEMLPPRIHPLQLAGRGLHAIASFITERHTIPYAEHAPTTGADEMLLGEQES